MEKYLNFLPTAVTRDAALAPIITAATPSITSAASRFKWNLNPTALAYVQHMGITANPFAVEEHTHPVHKTHEVNLLHVDWASKATKESTVLYMKKSKFDELQKQQSNFKYLINQLNTPRDLTRYDEQHSGPVLTPLAFMHDSLMYITPAQIIDLFVRSPKLQTLYASLIHPVEAEFGLQSFFPSLYQFKRVDRSLTYMLESKSDGAYTQPLNCQNWLRINKLVYKDMVLSVTLIKTAYSFHQLLITRVVIDCLDPHRIFETPRSTLLPDTIGLKTPLSSRLVPQEVCDMLFQYVRSVRTLRVTDPPGVIRTQRTKPEYAWVSNQAWDLLTKYAADTATFRPTAEFQYHQTVLGRFKTWILKNRTSLITILGGFSTLYFAYKAYQKRHLMICFRFLSFQVLGDSPPSWFSLSFSDTPDNQLRRFIMDKMPQNIWPYLSDAQRNLLKPHGIRLPYLCHVFGAISGLCFTSYFWLSRKTPQAVSDAYMDFISNERFYLRLECSQKTIKKPKDFFQSVKTEEQMSDALSKNPFYPTPTLPPKSDIPKKVSFDLPKPPVITNEPKAHEKSEVVPDFILEDLNDAQDFMEDVMNDNRKPSERLITMDSMPDRPQTPPVVDFDSEICQPETPPSSPPKKQKEMKDLPKLSKLNVTTNSSKSDEPTSSKKVNLSPELLEECRPMREWFPQLYWGEFDGMFLIPRVTSPYSIPLLNQDCLLESFENATGISRQSYWSVLCSAFPRSNLTSPECVRSGLNEEHLSFLAAYFGFFVMVHTDTCTCAYGDSRNPTIYFKHSGSNEQGHWENSSKSAFERKLRGGYSNKIAYSRIYPLMVKASKIKQPLACKQIFEFTPDRERAKTLLNNMKQGCDGILHHKLGKENVPSDLFEMWKQKVLFTPARKFEMILIQGFAGCGKSSPVMKVIKSDPNYRVSVPTTHLRDEWKDGVKPDKMNTWRISTWEMALLRYSALAVIDEIYKIPPGYLDLLCFLDPTLTSLIVLGDPCQGEYHSVDPNSTVGRILPEKQRLKPFFDIYCAWTYRLDQTTAKALGIRTFSKDIGHPVIHQHRVNSKQPILTSSRNIAISLCENSLRAQTMASSQGLTFNMNVGIYLDKHILAVSRESALVAVTRSRRGYFTTGDQSMISSLHASPFLYVFGIRKGSVLHDFRDVLNDLHLIYDPSQLPSFLLRGGGSKPSKKQKIKKHKDLETVPLLPKIKTSKFVNYEDDVMIDNREPIYSYGLPRVATIDSTFVPETKRVLLASFESGDPEEIIISSADFTEPVAEPVYPGCDYNALKFELLRSVAPASLEKLGPSGLSNQFPFIDKPYEEEADYPGLVAPQHNIKADPDLLVMSIDKRLRFRRAEISKITAEDQLAGTLLYYSYCQALNISSEPIPFNETLFLECILDNDYVQLTSKTKAAIIANQNRSDPSWKHTVVRIFTKTQHKINLNTLFTEWKACQTLALMHDIIVLLLGPVKKYQRAILAQDPSLNKNIFILGGKSPRDLSKFAQTHFPRGVERVANDYTSFDQSQGAEAVYFEILKMRRVGIPENLIDLHEELKTKLTCQFGPLTPMRFTGEPGTYDDNTDFNLAIINLEYYLGNTPLCISGDDSLLAYEPFKRSSWSINSQYFKKLIWKKEKSLYGEFCGYYVSHAGAVRAPRPMLAKLALSEARSELGLTIPSYLAEFCVGHSLGDALWECLPLSEVLWQSAVFDFFCRKTPRDLKVALKHGEIPDHLLLKMGRPLTHQAFCTLSHASRRFYLRLQKSNPHNWTS